jgi:putative tryptophan/tyrosine transport system substrate-binding protein
MLVGGAAAAWPLAARAQQPAMPVVGFLNGQVPAEYVSAVAAFREGLGAAGYVEGRNVTLEFRWAEGRYDKLPALAADLVSRRVTVIATGGITLAALAAKAATTTIPIVFLTGADPIKMGLVASLSRPGGNATGVSFFINVLAAKRLELLRELVPSVTTIGLLWNPTSPVSELEMKDAETAAHTLGLPVIIQTASSEREIAAAFAGFAQQRIDALFILSDPFFMARRRQVATLAMRHGLPTSVGPREAVEAGCLFSYSASVNGAYRQVGTYVGRVLKGEKPADLPVVQPTKFEFIINLTTAKALGLTVPDKLLALADEVIE